MEPKKRRSADNFVYIWQHPLMGTLVVVAKTTDDARQQALALSPRAQAFMMRGQPVVLPAKTGAAGFVWRLGQS